MVRRDVPQRRSTDGNHRWDAVVKIAQIMSVLALAWIGYLTKVSGDKANLAAIETQQTRAVVANIVAVQDTIHNLVDGTKSRLDSLVVEVQDYNTTLRDQLKAAGIKPARQRREANP